MDELLDTLDERIAKIENDDRLPDDYPEECAGTETNVVLALIQTDLSAKLDTMKWIRDELREETEMWA
jgi:hypothetical protein